MRFTLLILFAFAAAANAGVFFSQPDDWIEVELPNPDPSSITVVEGFTSPNELPRVVVTQFGVIRSMSDAESMLKGQLDAMDRASHKHGVPTDTVVHGYTAKHVESEISRPDIDPILIDNYIVFTSAGVLSVAIMADQHTGGREQNSALLDRLKLPGEPIDLILSAGQSAEESDAYRAGELLGRVLMIGLLLLVIGWIVKNRLSRRTAI